MSWRFDDPYNMERNYSFNYDGLNRLKSAGYWDEEFNFYDTNYDYDKMGNLLSLSRWGTMEAREDFAKVDDLSFTYNGNQVKSIDDSTEDYITYTPLDFIDNAKEEEEYFYDSNGNLIKDLNKGIDEIQYNCLNLPNYITLRERNVTRYLYSADGVKRRKEYGVWELFSIEPAFSFINMRNSLQKTGTGTNSIEFYSFVSNECMDYCGNIIYKNGVLDKVLTEEGYINFVNGAPVYHYYLKDHQGNIRVVMNQNGIKEGLNHYYPFGSLFGEGYDSQQYKYGGKELDKVHGLNWYDFSARYYDSPIGRFHMMDPLCEKYYSVSPYAYCGNNPIKYIDSTGMSWRPTYDEDHNGNRVYNGYEWVDEAESYNEDGTLKSGLYAQAIFFSDNGTFDSSSDYNIGSSTATVYLADGTTTTFEANTNPSSSDYAIVPEGIYHATVGIHNGSKSRYTALKLRDEGAISQTIELNAPNPAHLDRTYAEGINIHKPGVGNLTGFTRKKTPISQGCLLIDINDWSRFIGIFDTDSQRSNIVSTTVSRSMVTPANVTRLPAFNFILNGTRRSFFSPFKL